MRPALALAACAGAAYAGACDPIAPSPGSPAPVNACPEFACVAADGGASGVTPSCSGGACVVVESVTQTSWVAVIASPTDAFYAPGVTWAMSYGDLLNSPLATTAPAVARAACTTQPCAQLPAVAVTQGFVDCQPAAATKANWYLGPTDVAFPVTATFTPLWPDPRSKALVDATTLGLPLSPVVAATVPAGLSVEVLPGPGGGPSLIFEVPDPPGLGRISGLPPVRASPTAASSYERDLTPLAPFGQAFPPDVSVIDSAQQASGESVVLSGFDATIQSATTHVPTFTLSRADGGPLDGWSAYLRDATTGRLLSNRPPLSGTGPTVQLLTSHHTADALTDAQLVMQPPLGDVLPTWIFTPVNADLSEKIPYPAFPPSVVAAAQVLSEPGGTGVAADLVIEAVDLCRFAQGQSQPVHDLLTAPPAHFAYQRFVTTDAQGRFSTALPLGNYRVTVVPHDGAHAEQIVSPYVLADAGCNPAQAATLLVPQAQRVRGDAVVYDGRPLAGATVEAMPAACARAPALDGLPALDTACLPRFAATETAVDGSYTLTLDPGSYELRVRPAEGSRFPWVVQPLSVTSTTTTAPSTRVPAPVAAGLTLYDPNGNALFDTLVRVFDLPASGPPYVEIGSALTDAQGHYDMYLAPPSE